MPNESKGGAEESYAGGSNVLARLGDVPSKELAIARAQAFGSIDGVVGAITLRPEQVDTLPYLLLQTTTIESSSWAYVARILKEIKESDVWERIDDGKYKDDWEGFLKEYTKGQKYSATRATRLLDYLDWFDKNKDKINKAKPESCENETSQIPREMTMKMVFQYKEAFEEYPGLLAMVFWYETEDPDVLRAEVAGVKGAPYVASREPKRVRSKRLGGDMAKPTFGPYSTNRDEFTVLIDALDILLPRFRSLMVNLGAYEALDFGSRQEVRRQIADVVEHMLKADGDFTDGEL